MLLVQLWELFINIFCLTSDLINSILSLGLLYFHVSLFPIFIGKQFKFLIIILLLIKPIYINMDSIHHYNNGIVSFI